MKKKFAFRHHLVGSARISSADFLSCLEPKELTFALQKDGRESNRGDIVATLQFEVTHRNLNSVDALRPGHYRRIALQLINRVVLSTLRELPKGAEYVFPCDVFHFASTPTPLYSNSRLLQHPFTPTPLYSNSPLLQLPFTPTPLYSNSPLLQHPLTPTPLYSTTPLLQLPFTPTPLYSNSPLFQLAFTPTRLYSNTP
jgi:hypothetical protein